MHFKETSMGLIDQSRDLDSGDRMYGHRARIGYTSPFAATEVFPYEFYLIAPKGVSLVVSTLGVMERSKAEIDRSYDMSLQAAKALARVQVDLIVLGGVPINLSRGSNVEALIRQVERETGVPVATSITAQIEALRTVGARRVAVGHPYTPDQDPMFAGYAEKYGFDSSSVKGAGYTGPELGRMPRNAALALGRALLEADPKADTIWLTCPHWAMAEAIEPLEQELGVTVVTALQAITWHALRRCNVTDKVEGYGRLLRDF
jgi:maleate cis-trans isomerase